MANIFAIDWGGSKIETAVINQGGDILWRSRKDLPAGYAYDEGDVLQVIEAEFSKMVREFPQNDAHLAGVSIPGPSDPYKRVLLSNGGGIHNWAVGQAVEDLLKMPVCIEKDVNACATAEKLFGCCKDTTDFIWITVSSGCGGGLYLNNKLYRGQDLQAGEIGHIRLEYDDPSPVTEDGVFGDMENEGAGNAIGRKYLRLTRQTSDPAFKSRQVGQLARQGDPVAKDIFFLAGTYIAKMCAMAANLLNLQKVVLGGGVAVYDFELMEPGIRATLPGLLHFTSRDLKVERTALGYDTSLLGAAAIVIDQKGYV